MDRRSSIHPRFFCAPALPKNRENTKSLRILSRLQKFEIFSGYFWAVGVSSLILLGRRGGSKNWVRYILRQILNNKLITLANGARTNTGKNMYTNQPCSTCSPENVSIIEVSITVGEAVPEYDETIFHHLPHPTRRFLGEKGTED